MWDLEGNQVNRQLESLNEGQKEHREQRGDQGEQGGGVEHRLPAANHPGMSGEVYVREKSERLSLLRSCARSSS